MEHRPLVSAVINNYNYADFLGEAIESALSQSWPETEVIVVDDGSTDGSRDVIAEYGDRIGVVLQPNLGQAEAFNAGVRQARGEIICFLDSDDVWDVQKVERVVEAFRGHPRAAWLRHRLRVVDQAKRPLGAVLPRFRGTRLRAPLALAFLEGCYPVPTSALALRRELADRLFPLPAATAANGTFPGVDLMRDADAYLTFRAAATGEHFLSLDEELGLYRRHRQQRYFSGSDIEPVLERQIALGAGLATAFTETLGDGLMPSSVHKHRAVLAAVHGRPLLHRERLAPALAGLRCVLPLARISPWLFARQSLALALGALAPRYWIRKLMRQQGFMTSTP
jgi:hypothetical protein